MTPHVTSCLTESLPSPQNKQDKPIPSHREQIVWFNVAALGYLHIAVVITFLFSPHLIHRYTYILNVALVFWSGYSITAGAHRLWAHRSYKAKWPLQNEQQNERKSATALVEMCNCALLCFNQDLALGFWSGYSITAGAHRLWAHRSYKAKWPLRLILAIGHTITFQFDIYEWVRTHRVHHKFTDTDADPHNSKRGFFFSQIGWILIRKHKDVIVKGRTVDMSDLERDWIIMWQKRLFLLVGPLFCFVLPTFIPIYFWGEDFWMAWHVNAGRFLTTIHFGGLVNSVAHTWGTKPYNRNVSSADNQALSFFALGEGWHNYHHAFPWDYKAAELGNYKYNATTCLLDLCGKLGLAYDFKVASPEMIRKKVMRTGDGSHHIHSHEGEVWGWGDQDMDKDDKEMVTIINPDKRRNRTE